MVEHTSVTRRSVRSAKAWASLINSHSLILLGLMGQSKVLRRSSWASSSPWPLSYAWDQMNGLTYWLWSKSILNNAPCPQRAVLSPFKALTGLSETPPAATICRSSTVSAVTNVDVAREQTRKMDSLCTMVSDLHPVIQEVFQDNHQCQLIQTTKVQFSNLCEGDFVLIAREDFAAGKKCPFVGRALDV